MKIGDLGECKKLTESINYISIAGTPGFMDASILQKSPVSVLADGRGREKHEKRKKLIRCDF